MPLEKKKKSRLEELSQYTKQSTQKALGDGGSPSKKEEPSSPLPKSFKTGNFTEQLTLRLSPKEKESLRKVMEINGLESYSQALRFLIRKI